jgi:hypothetical protein
VSPSVGQLGEDGLVPRWLGHAEAEGRWFVGARPQVVAVDVAVGLIERAPVVEPVELEKEPPAPLHVDVGFTEFVQSTEAPPLPTTDARLTVKGEPPEPVEEPPADPEETTLPPQLIVATTKAPAIRKHRIDILPSGDKAALLGMPVVGRENRNPVEVLGEKKEGSRRKEGRCPSSYHGMSPTLDGASTARGRGLTQRACRQDRGLLREYARPRDCQGVPRATRVAAAKRSEVTTFFQRAADLETDASVGRAGP